MLSLCCSSICITRDLASLRYFGVLPSSFFPLGLLVYRSRFLPRFLGVWLSIDGFTYVILSLTSVLLPQYFEKVYTISQPALFGEVALMLWLVIKGAKPEPLPRSVILGGGLGCTSWIVGGSSPIR